MVKNSYKAFSVLKEKEDEILKLREQGMSYKKLAKKFKVEFYHMESFLKNIETNRLYKILDEIKANRKQNKQTVPEIENREISETQ